MMLGKYQMKKRLGKGAYGQVVLVNDKTGNQFAVKMISLKTFSGQNAYLLDYLESQIKCLKQMNSPYVMKLNSTEEDKNCKYMICQYCDGGDIISVQAKQPNKVFCLQKASQILSFVIKGLQCLHDSGFVHRDIKAENILMKTQKGKQVYKLSDFGFTKNIKDISFTILGTGAYMSPQIYNQDQYGFEVDMWAFGVLFYFMLNMQFPFKPNQAPDTSKKSQQLMKAATNYSYKSSVEKSRKKILQNCTGEVQDLFKKMFNPLPKERINFHDIRQHSIFKKHFPDSLEDNFSRILYKPGNKKIRNKNLNPQIVNPPFSAKDPYSGISIDNKQFMKQNKMIESQIDKIQFLKQVQLQIQKNSDLPFPELLSFKYNVQKYTIVRLRNILRLLKQKQIQKKCPQLNWKDFLETDDLKTIKTALEQSLKKSEFQIEKTYDDCEQNIRSIISINSHFIDAFTKNIDERELQGIFKKSFRRSTIICYEILVKRLRKQKNKGNLVNYQLALVTICHAINKIYDQGQNHKKIFQDYFFFDNIKLENVNFLNLKAFMAACTAGQLNAITKAIIDTYFTK